MVAAAWRWWPPWVSRAGWSVPSTCRGAHGSNGCCHGGGDRRRDHGDGVLTLNATGTGIRLRLDGVPGGEGAVWSSATATDARRLRPAGRSVTARASTCRRPPPSPRPHRRTRGDHRRRRGVGVLPGGRDETFSLVTRFTSCVRDVLPASTVGEPSEEAECASVLAHADSTRGTRPPDNALFRRNLAKGQTGLSVAFDLPTQTGYDPDDELARGEVGKVGVPVGHIGDMRTLFDGIPLGRGQHLDDDQRPGDVAARALRRRGGRAGRGRAQLAGTTQNDIVKEYLSRGTYVFPPAPSMRLITDMIAWSVAKPPEWNPINICSYHLQEAGATRSRSWRTRCPPAIAVLDSVRDSGQVPPGGVRRRRRADLVLRQRGPAVRRGDVQDAGLGPALGRDHPRALRGHRRQGPRACATASRSTRSGSPRRSRRTTSSASCSRCSR